MTRYILGAVVCSAAALSQDPATSTPPAEDPPSRVARVSFVNGSISYRPGSSETWGAATLNDPVTVADNLWSDHNSRAELHIGATAIRLSHRSGVTVLNLDDHVVQLRLTEGAMHVRIRKLESDEAFEVDTMNVSVSLTAAGDYRIEAEPDSGQTRIIVRRGRAEVQLGSPAILRDGESLAVRGVDQPRGDGVAAPPEDDWERWCRTRDSREDRSVSARYVSTEMTGYEDLDDHGEWTSTSEYGALWVPRSVQSDWAPYRNGHWGWVEPWGWTWVDDAPWGFAPFHYGRWVTHRGRWAWAPGAIGRPVYAPALVMFVGGPDGMVSFGGGRHFAWFPLGYGEVYRPSYGHGRGYLERVNMSHVRRLPMSDSPRYMHQHMVTVVPHSAFVGAHAVHRSIVRVPTHSMGGYRVVGATAFVAPRRESFLGHRSDMRVRVAMPPARMSTLRVVTRRETPRPPVPFSVRERAMQAHPGRPLDRRTMETYRPRGSAGHPLVRSAPVRAGNPIDRQPVDRRPGGPVGGRRTDDVRPGNRTPVDARRVEGNRPGGTDRRPGDTRSGGIDRRPGDTRSGGRNRPGGYTRPASGTQPPGGVTRPADANRPRYSGNPTGAGPRPSDLGRSRPASTDNNPSRRSRTDAGEDGMRPRRSDSRPTTQPSSPAVRTERSGGQRERHKREEKK